ncbi:MAG: RidA family protein [Eubacteriales bacterium]|nr:RidA family protein [Eubacteriales bacterium]MDY3332236.1 RidA family protein [Gallibacter sp.]
MAEIIFTKDAPAAVGPYSQAIKTGNTVYCSGQIPLVPETGALLEGDIKQQTKRCFENIEAVLKAAGGSLDNIVKTTVFLINMSDFAEVNEMYAECLGDNKPARSCVAVAELPKGAQIEIEVLAVL